MKGIKQYWISIIGESCIVTRYDSSTIFERIEQQAFETNNRLKPISNFSLKYFLSKARTIASGSDAHIIYFENPNKGHAPISSSLEYILKDLLSVCNYYTLSTIKGLRSNKSKTTFMHLMLYIIEDEAIEEVASLITHNEKNVRMFGENLANILKG